MEFVLVFLPAVMGINLLLRGKARNYWLLLSSLFFYAWGEPSFVFVMIGSILLNYIIALLIECCSNRIGWKKILLVIDIVCNLSIIHSFSLPTLSRQLFVFIIFNEHAFVGLDIYRCAKKRRRRIEAVYVFYFAAFAFKDHFS